MGPSNACSHLLPSLHATGAMTGMGQEEPFPPRGLSSREGSKAGVAPNDAQGARPRYRVSVFLDWPAPIDSARFLVARSAARLLWAFSRPSDQTTASCASRVAGIDPHPPGPQQWRGVLLRHFDRAVGGHGAVDAGKQLDVRDAARGA